MKRSKLHIVLSWVLLICFVAGQYMVYAHQHISTGKPLVHIVSKTSAQATVKEKCGLCDAMHHMAMVISTHVHHHTLAATDFIFKKADYHFKSIQLTLASSRAPPVS